MTSLYRLIWVVGRYFESPAVARRGNDTGTGATHKYIQPSPSVVDSDLLPVVTF